MVTKATTRDDEVYDDDLASAALFALPRNFLGGVALRVRWERIIAEIRASDGWKIIVS